MAVLGALALTLKTDPHPAIAAGATALIQPKYIVDCAVAVVIDAIAGLVDRTLDSVHVAKRGAVIGAGPGAPAADAFAAAVGGTARVADVYPTGQARNVVVNVAIAVVIDAVADLGDGTCTGVITDRVRGLSGVAYQAAVLADTGATEAAELAALVAQGRHVVVHSVAVRVLIVANLGAGTDFVLTRQGGRLGVEVRTQPGAVGANTRVADGPARSG